MNEVEEVSRKSRLLIDQQSEFEQLRCRSETWVDLNQSELAHRDVQHGCVLHQALSFSLTAYDNLMVASQGHLSCYLLLYYYGVLLYLGLGRSSSRLTA